jgi:TolA-binding protein
MNVVDLHPEDLLDKDALGTLEEGERVRLEAHVSHCSACRFERQLRADFALDLDSDAPSERLANLGTLPIELLPDRPDAASAAKKDESRAVLRPVRRRKTGFVWLFAAAVLLVGGAAAAMSDLGHRSWTHFMGIDAPASRVSPAPEGTRPKVHAAGPLTPPAPPASPAAPEPTTAPQPIEGAPLKPATHAARPAPVAAAPVHTIGAAELFDNATDARRRGDYAHVLDADRELEGRFPTSREAQVLRAVVGRVLLDHGDSAAALKRFDAYLAGGGGDLAEDAMVGRATALDRLGRTDEAAQAWSTLLATYPTTPYATHAKARLATLNGH